MAHHKKGAFLAAYSECGSIATAAKLAGIGRRSHYRWLKVDAKYAERFREAHEGACDALEDEARRRAVDGIERPVYYKGQPVGTVRDYSDTLLIFLLKGAMPDKYRERATDRHGSRGRGSQQVEVVYTDDWHGQRSRAVVHEMLNHPDYLDYQRHKAARAGGIDLAIPITR